MWVDQLSSRVQVDTDTPSALITGLAITDLELLRHDDHEAYQEIPRHTIWNMALFFRDIVGLFVPLAGGPMYGFSSWSE